MSAISFVNLRAYTEKLGLLFRRFGPVVGLSTDASPPASSAAAVLTAMTAVITGSNDATTQIDFVKPAQESTDAFALDRLVTAAAKPAFDAINDHYADRGPDAFGDDTAGQALVTSLDEYLQYMNGGDGGVAFANMLTPEFAEAWAFVMGDDLSPEGVMAPACHPAYTAGASANGAGKRAVGGSFADGDGIDSTTHSAAHLMCEVIVNFASGAAPPTITVAATDNTGASTNFTTTLSGNNPTAAVATTITPAVTALTRPTVAVGSLTGIVAGSVMTVNDGLADEETVVIESVGSGSITAAFTLAHDAGAALTGYTTVQLTPATAGRRAYDVTGITIGISSHSAGEVRTFYRQERGNV